MQAHAIADASALQAAVRVFEEARALAVDLETDSMYAYAARLCFLQVSDGSAIYVIDTLAPGVEPTAMREILAEPGRRKIFHDAQGDLREFAKHGLRVRGLFDTQRAATFLGLPKVGLGDLVEERFGVQLAKEHQTANFGQRPLPGELWDYVADDVRYLLPLAEQLEAEAREQDIWEELELEFERIAEEALLPEPPPRPKLPGQARTPLGVAVAEAVDAIRHREAKARNLPPGRVLSNATLGQIAVQRPRRMDALRRIHGVKGSFVRACGREVVDAIARLEEVAARDELPPLPKRPKPDPARRQREERLRAWRSEAAKARKVTPSVVLPTPLIERLVAEPPRNVAELREVPYLGEKRVERYGKAILETLRDPA